MTKLEAAQKDLIELLDEYFNIENAQTISLYPKDRKKHKQLRSKIAELEAKEEPIQSLPVKDISEEAKDFVQWMGDDGGNPFIAKDKDRWIQTCGNSTSWTIEELYKMYLKSKQH